MITKEEHHQIADIKRRALSGGFVYPSEKQWILDLMKREKVAAHRQSLESARKQGFNVQGLEVL
jgi:phage I-like protein